MTLHPKHAESIARREAQQRDAAICLSREREIARRLELHYTHVRPLDTKNNCPGSKGGATVAWNYKYKNHSLAKRWIEVSVAICSPKDTYCKRTGRLHAAVNFERQHRIALRVPRDMRPAEFLLEMFAPAALDVAYQEI
jgi:hypothetical protein